MFGGGGGGFLFVGVEEEGNQRPEGGAGEEGAGYAVSERDDGGAGKNPNHTQDESEDLAAEEKVVVGLDQGGFQFEAGGALRFRHGENPFSAVFDAGPVAFKFRSGWKRALVDGDVPFFVLADGAVDGRRV